MCLYLSFSSEFKVLNKSYSSPKEAENDDLFQNTKAQQGWALTKKGGLQQSQGSLPSFLAPGSMVKSDLCCRYDYN